MKYRKDSAPIENALGLDKSQVIRIKNAIKRAYDSIPDRDFNIDELNAFVAPYIKTPEEAFFAATVIITDVMGSAMKLGVMPKY